MVAAMKARPDYWITEASDIAAVTEMTERGVQAVLYHLSDAGVVEYTDFGWQFTDTHGRKT